MGGFSKSYSFKKVTLSVLFLVLFLSSSLFASSSNDYNLRNKTTPCGFYLAPKSNTTFGTQLSEGLEVSKLKKALEENPNFDPSKMFLYAVGTSMSKSENKKLVSSTKEALLEQGYNEADVLTIRRMQDFVENQKGVWTKNLDGTFEKVAELTPKNILKISKNLDPKKEYIVVGAPLYGKFKKFIKKHLQANLPGDKKLKFKSSAFQTLKVSTRKVTQSPVQSAKHLVQQARYFFPLKEDMQRPQSSEYKSTFKKVVVPAMLTFAVLLSSGRELNVVLPVTIINAAQSTFTALFSSFTRNWWSRSKNFFPTTWCKNMIYGTVFTANIYWAARLLDPSFSVANDFGTLFTLGAAATLATTKWASVLFNNLWRVPMHTAVYRWEAWKNDSLKTIANNEKAVEMRSNLERYASYFTTQFYIMSVVSDNTTARLYTLAGKIYFQTGEGAGILKDGATNLLSLNFSHFVMLGVGAVGLVGMKYRSITNFFANLVDVFTYWEQRAFNFIFKKPKENGVIQKPHWLQKKDQ